MKDNLDQLEPAQLSILVAMEIAGWQNTLCSVANPFDRGGMRLPNGFSDPKQVFTAWWHPSDPLATGCYIAPPRFAESADAVLPFLEKLELFPEIMRPWHGMLSPGPEDEAKRVWEVRFDTVWAIAPTLARAICIALIRYVRATKGQG